MSPEALISCGDSNLGFFLLGWGVGMGLVILWNSVMELIEASRDE